MAGYVIVDTTLGAYTADATSCFSLNYGPNNNYCTAFGVVAWIEALTTPDVWVLQLGSLGSVGTGDLANVVLGSFNLLSKMENKSLSVGDILNGVADYTDGHANNTVTVTIDYTVRTLL